MLAKMSFQNLGQEAVHCSPYRSDLLEHCGTLCFLLKRLLFFDPSNARN